VLITLKYSLAELLNGLPLDVGILHRRISEGIREVDQAMTSIRSISQSLRPPLLDAGGLNISLKDLCEEVNRRTSIKVTYKGLELDNLSDGVAVTLFRFVQEAISNALKHSKATRLRVTLKYVKRTIIVTAVDNGIGIRDLQNTTGIGLVGLKERIGFLGGGLQVKSVPGKGTTIQASIPWMGVALGSPASEL
jgi:signal transduction histidine kinase